MNKKGFTLIELLVVIAIIGILATIVLASLNSARAKANDTAVKADLNNSRAAAELFYDNSGVQSYLGVCASATGIAPMVSAASQTAGIVAAVSNTMTVAGSATQAVCHDAAGTWVANVPLKSNSALSWCVDNTGTSTQKTGYIAANDIKC